MITQEQFAAARNQFLLASDRLHFEILSPFVLDEVKQLSAFAYLPDYGSVNGVVIELAAPPEFKQDLQVVNWCKKNQVFYSCLNIEPLLKEFDVLYFKVLLHDWKLSP